ncbi:MarR family transcriptional regulator, partial [Thomasclavelia sp.]|uniref:MarR family winged helix-turn-helix transcriptional regulator n=1 Tax=Thomasclavelia sp. TaxID=3025757 RepID=UPI0025DEE6F5
ENMQSRDKIDLIYSSVNGIDRIYQKWAKSQNVGYYDMLLYYALMEIDNQGMTQVQFYKELDIPKTTVNSIVKNQLKQGYIYFEVNPKNKKEKLIYLSESGLEYAKKLILPLFAIEEHAASLIDDQEVEMFSKILSTYAKGLLEKMNL